MPVANCNRPAGEQDYPVTCYIDKGMKKHEYNSRLQGDQHVPVKQSADCTTAFSWPDSKPAVSKQQANKTAASKQAKSKQAELCKPISVDNPMA